MENLVGTYINFISHNGVPIIAYIIREDKTSFDYIRDSMTKWNCDKKSVYRSAVKITRKEFIRKVQQNAIDTNKTTLIKLGRELTNIFFIEDDLTINNERLLEKIKNNNEMMLQTLKEYTFPTEKKIIKALSEFKKDFDVDYNKIIEILK